MLTNPFVALAVGAAIGAFLDNILIGMLMGGAIWIIFSNIGK